MYSRAIWKYYLDVNMFTLPFSLFFGFTSGIFWSLIIFSSFGILIGYIGFGAFKKNEYFGYHNLGLTKMNLIKKVWTINTSISFLVLLIYIIIN